MRAHSESGVPATGASLLASTFVVVSSACCVGPLAVVLSFFGLTGTTLLAIENVVGPYRPIILGLTTLLLGAGFYYAYRSETACEPDAVCSRPASRRLQRFAVWLATLVFAILLYFTYVHPNLDVLFGIYT